MINKDKFGNILNPWVFRKIQKTGNKLETLNYIEAPKKPNLFYFPDIEITFFADLRGTENVPIWEDTTPLLYFKINDSGMKENQQIDAIIDEIGRLASENIQVRFAFPALIEPDSIYFHNEYIYDSLSKRYRLPYSILHNSPLEITSQNGYCVTCKKNMHKGGFFCSDNCREKYILRYYAKSLDHYKNFCEICNSRILPEDLYNELPDKIKRNMPDAKFTFKKHHASYFPEKTIIICADCYRKIRNKSKYPEYWPPAGDFKKFHSTKKNKGSS